MRGERGLVTSCARGPGAERAGDEDDVRVVEPRPTDVEALVRLSRRFVEEVPWAATIPIGQMTGAKEASERLFGDSVVAVRLAETTDGEVVGYVGVCRHAEVVDISILVQRSYRRRGLGRRLVEQVFDDLPAGLKVEAWVAASNAASRAAMPAMGFVLDRTIEDRGRTVYVYGRTS